MNWSHINVIEREKNLAYFLFCLILTRSIKKNIMKEITTFPFCFFISYEQKSLKNN